MQLPMEFFDEFHKEHPHRIRADRIEEEWDRFDHTGLPEVEEVMEALKRGETVVSANGHELSLVTRSVRPWINWRQELHNVAPAIEDDILKKHPTQSVLYLQVA